MSINDGILLVVLAFFGCLLYCIRKEEKRKADRRQLDLPPPVERRRQERRSKGLGVALAWAGRALRSALTHR
jgi:hypothetical protein